MLLFIIVQPGTQRKTVYHGNAAYLLFGLDPSLSLNWITTIGKLLGPKGETSVMYISQATFRLPAGALTAELQLPPILS